MSEEEDGSDQVREGPSLRPLSGRLVSRGSLINSGVLSLQLENEAVCRPKARVRGRTAGSKGQRPRFFRVRETKGPDRPGRPGRGRAIRSAGWRATGPQGKEGAWRLTRDPPLRGAWRLARSRDARVRGQCHTRGAVLEVPPETPGLLERRVLVSTFIISVK